MARPSEPSGTSETSAAAARTLSGLRLFISYARGGRAHSVAEQVQRHLQSEGAQVFRDETGVREGDLDALAGIERELLAADVVVYLLAAETPASGWQ